MLFFGHLLVRSLAQRRAPMSIPSREGLTQEVPYRIEGLNVSVSREAHVGRSGDSARERRVVVLLATSGASCAVKVCREKRRARRQWRELTHADGGHQHCICLIASFPPHRKFALKTPDYMGNRTADRRFKLKTNLIKNFLPHQPDKN